ncbi:unnamed protein product [Lactuca virosa]|uniref:SAP domain-containing protein n=1 Tax=Lactuca virosa TaxID=75947 RepID=A0AAU9M6H2_9ASTR|nr:unnamed protein product [Lactuca virosa]
MMSVEGFKREVHFLLQLKTPRPSRNCIFIFRRVSCYCTYQLSFEPTTRISVSFRNIRQVEQPLFEDRSIGEMSSKKPSSPYVVFENRSLDQWKVTELKEELKKRKLVTRGLKDDLVKRLDEAIRAELEEDNQNHENGVNDDEQPEIPSDDAVVDPIVADKTMDDNIAKNESIKEDNVTEKVDKNESLDQDHITEKLDKDESLDKDKVTENLDDENRDKDKESNSKPLPKEEEAEPNSSEIGSQVVEVSQVKSDSISIVSITEKNELKDNVITDDVKLELDVKPSILDDGGKTDPVVVDEKDFKIAETESKKNDILDVGSPEKLNLDDDSMEEDALESKQSDSNFTSQDIIEKTQIPLVDVMVEDTNTEIADVSTKRKQYDQEAVANNEVVKRQRRWNSNNALEQITTPKGSSIMKHSFSRSDSSVSHEEPKERVVPPSSKPATTSLRVDHFLRPFTLKAVQELLGKTGTVVSFWMDHIKTHCYVTYSSVEEAVETRNAVYNLQWPANGGRLLMAEFVDPSEVKTRTDPPPPPTPVTTTTTTPLALPPPPPLSLPPQSREPPQHHLPPAPPLPEKLEPPIMTLDDLFRKTRATPRIYYLPLSDEQVAGKLKTQGKTVVKQ